MRTPPELDAAIRAAAAHEGKRITWLVERILTNWLIKRGYLQAKEVDLG